MSKIQWIAFRIIIQFLAIICGQVLGIANRDFGIKLYWKTCEHLELFYLTEPNLDVEE